MNTRTGTQEDVTIPNQYGTVRFDPDLPPEHEVNKQAAQNHKLRWNEKKQHYTDETGALVRDRFGQPL